MCYRWKIDRDYLNEKSGSYYQVGRGRRSIPGALPLEAGTERWRLLDDDGVICFGGWLEDDDTGNYSAWESIADFGETWACTEVQGKDSNGEWRGVIG